MSDEGTSDSPRPSRYGRRLTSTEYSRRLTELHRRLRAEGDSSRTPADLDQQVRALELDLAIDRRLGVDFPREARKRLLRSREQVEARRADLAERLLRSEVTKQEFVAHMQEVVDDVLAELSAVLTPEEAKAFLGLGDLGKVSLGLDPDRIGEGRG